MRLAALAGTITLLAACGGGGAGGNTTAAATPDLKTEAGITALLDQADAAATAAGYARDPSEPDVIRALSIDGDIDEIATFQIGARYRLVGRCGTGCGEIGIAASWAGPTGNGQEPLGATDDGFPIESVALDITAPADGRAKVTLTMWECSAQPCTAGWRVYKAGS